MTKIGSHLSFKRTGKGRPSAFTWVAPLALALIASGCAALTHHHGEREAASGADAYRHEARSIALNEVVTDSVSIADGDQTDWYMIEIYDAGQLSVEIKVDDGEAALSAALHDRYGKEIKIFKVPGAKLSTFTVDVSRRGRYFLKVRSEAGPLTSYDVRVYEGAPSNNEGGDVPANRPGF